MPDLDTDQRPTGYQPPLTWPEPPSFSTGATGSQPPASTPPPSAEPAPRPSGWRTAVISAAVAAVVATGVAVPVTLVATSEGDGAATVTAGDGDGSGLTETSGESTGSAASGSRSDAAPAPTGAVMTVAEVAEAVAPSVARVDVQVPGGQGSGSAVAYRADGYLLTNAHVVANATAVAVTLPEGTRLEAEVVGGDVTSDLAVLRVDPEDIPGGELPAAVIAEETPRIGETAIAIGSPFELDGSVTAGIVSGLGRSIPGTALSDLIQTDAPINPGNSGGALVNDRAEVIGINTAILGSGGGGASGGNIGIGFAIPITTATHLADQLIDEGVIRYAQLGVQGQDVDPRIAELYGLPVSEGALIVEVGPGSAADEAGLERGDIVTAIDGEEVASMAELAGQIRRRSPGDDVTLTVAGGGAEREVEVTLGAAEADQGQLPQNPQ